MSVSPLWIRRIILTLSAQWPCGRVSVLRLGGCLISGRVIARRWKWNPLPSSLPLGIQGWNWAVRSPNDSWGKAPLLLTAPWWHRVKCGNTLFMLWNVTITGILFFIYFLFSSGSWGLVLGAHLVYELPKPGFLGIGPDHKVHQYKSLWESCGRSNNVSVLKYCWFYLHLNIKY